MSTLSRCFWYVSVSITALILLTFPSTAIAQSGTPMLPNLNDDALTASMLADPAWQVIKTADLNGDGNSDLIVYNSLTGQTAALIMYGTTVTGWTLLLTSPDWNVIEAADLNGDGKTDLLWYDAASGQIAAWLMGDVTATSWTVLIYSLDENTTFIAAGTYALRLTANDRFIMSTSPDDGIVTGTPPPPLVVDAGPDQIVTFPAPAIMAGTATDNGLPLGGTLTRTWNEVSGPGAVIFGNPSLPNTTATFPVSGSYTLRFTVSDGTLSASDDVVITVSAAESCGGTVSGELAVVANASDDVGVVGVQFKLDDANMAPELTSSPFSVSWNTTTVSNGCHTLSAVARDAAGNQGTTALLVTVSNP